MFFIKGQHHPKSVVDLGPKVGLDLNKKLISIRFFIPGFHCQMENNNAAPSALPQRGGALLAPQLWVLLFSIWQWTPGIKNLLEIGFFIQARANFWPRIETDFGWCWPLIKNTPSLNKKAPVFFVRGDH